MVARMLFNVTLLRTLSLFCYYLLLNLMSFTELKRLYRGNFECEAEATSTKIHSVRVISPHL